MIYNVNSNWISNPNPNSIPISISIQQEETTGQLDPILLFCCLFSVLFSTLYSSYTIYTHLLNYRKPILQRHVIRLLLMVPIYSLSSLISLFSIQAAPLIDLLRDLYEAFVIYSFFTLLVEYLGGERSILILLHGRQEVDHLWPFNWFCRKLDPSDPYTFLAIKRGVLRECSRKSILVVMPLYCISYI